VDTKEEADHIYNIWDDYDQNTRHLRGQIALQARRWQKGM